MRIQIPDGVRGVRPQVHPGWELSTVEGELDEPYESHGETVTRGVTEVQWSGGNLPDAYMDEFGLSVQIAPDAEGETLYFPAIQECENGAEAAWIEIPADGDAEEPEYPAPALEVTAPADDEHGAAEPAVGHGVGDAGSEAGAGGVDDAEPAVAMSAGAGGNALSVAALLLGVAGLGAGATALLRTRPRD